MKIAMIGTRGVPARYGGFETAVDEIGRRLVERGHAVTVFCRPGGEEVGPHHLGMSRVVLPVIPRRSLETLSHTALSVLHPALRGTDAAVVFNAANAPLLPVVRARGVPVATHVDGLEWRRAKWGPAGRRYYRLAEALAVRWSDALIADSRGIQEYYREEFDAPTRLIAYGAPILDGARSERLAELNLEPGGYHLVVARFEPENHVREIVQGYVHSAATLPLVVVGSAPYSDAYTRAVHDLADDRVRFLGGIWDQQLLDQLYLNCLTYMHGHSVGGTNPSLLRAAGAGAFVLAVDVVFNREVTADHAWYFRGPEDLSRLVVRAEANRAEVRALGCALRDAITRYSWDGVALEYERLCEDLAREGSLPRAVRLSGKRVVRVERSLNVGG